MHYNLMVHYDAGADAFPDKPFYVTEYKFGVADLWFKVVKEDAAGFTILIFLHVYNTMIWIKMLFK